MKKVQIRELQCQLCDWHSWGFKDDIDLKGFCEILAEANRHVYEKHGLKNGSKHMDMPFMPDDFPLHTSYKETKKRTN